MTSSGKLHRFPAAANLATTLLFAASLSAAALGIAVAEDASQAPAARTEPAAPAAASAPENPAPAPSSGLAFPPQPPAVSKPGFVTDLGHWWNESIASFHAKIKDAQQKLGDLNKKQGDVAKDAASATADAVKNAATATKDAATAVVRLPSTRVIDLHEPCATAPNGAPDCQAAAMNACRGKGFDAGQPLDVRTAEKCKASLWVSGQAPAEGQCPVETVVLRALCQ
jgi:hypothetical protein